ncbi:MAG: cytochrome c3 family protein [Thiohalomonadaceae bacterium]
MPAVFHPHANLLAFLGFLVLIALLVTGIVLWRLATAWPHGMGEPVQQPVPFSHKHHVRDDGIDCRYCHTSVESSAFAGMPPTATCMTCHSRLFTDAPLLKPVVDSLASGRPLRWNRVHQLPGFVYLGYGRDTCKFRILPVLTP